MACVNCKDKKTWTTLPKIDTKDMPSDLELVCGSDEKLQSWRMPLSYVLEKIDKLEKEVKKLKKEQEDGE